MRNNKHIVNRISYFLLLIALFIISKWTQAQPGPGDLGSPPELPSGGTPMGGSAPMESGIFILMVLALVYLAFKYHNRLRRSFGDLIG